MSKHRLMSGGRYPVLRALGIISVFAAVGILCVGAYLIGWSLLKFPGSLGERLSLAGIALAGTFFGAVVILALAELLKLMMDIEHNTRLALNGKAPAAQAPAAPSASTDGLDEESAEAALLRGH